MKDPIRLAIEANLRAVAAGCAAEIRTLRRAARGVTKPSWKEEQIRVVRRGMAKLYKLSEARRTYEYVRQARDYRIDERRARQARLAKRVDADAMVLRGFAASRRRLARRANDVFSALDFMAGRSARAGDAAKARRAYRGIAEALWLAHCAAFERINPAYVAALPDALGEVVERWLCDGTKPDLAALGFASPTTT